MNRNDYRRALIMLRSLKNGVSGYLRLERRTLMGTLQFTINGAPADGELYAILLYRKSGIWSAVRLSAFGPARYGQVGLVWKFDPRNIEGRTLEQYDLAAVIEIRDGVCELILAGNLAGSVETDWTQVREAACRLFSPVRISGAPISPIDDTLPDAEQSDRENSGLQTLPELNEELPAPKSAQDDLGNQDDPSGKSAAESVSSGENMADSPPDSGDGVLPDPSAGNSSSTIAKDETISRDSCGCTSEANSARTDELFEADEMDTPAVSAESDDLLDVPAADEIDSDEIDTPAENVYDTKARPALSLNTSPFPAGEAAEPADLDIPAQSTTPTAGDHLELDDPKAAWPEAIEPLRHLFFSSPAVVPFKGAEGYTFIRAPLPAECGMDSCMIGIHCEDGIPARVCYALPSAYTHEPPVGLEGYIWRGDHASGYWVICENVSSKTDEGGGQ